VFTECRDLLALALAAKILLPIARRHLYSNPLNNDVDSWERADALLASLQANEGAFGALVRTLINLPSSLRSLSMAPIEGGGEGGGEEASAEEQARKAFSWFVGIIASSLKLKEVGVTFQTPEQLDQILIALRPTLPTLKKVVLKKVNAGVVPLSIHADDTILRTPLDERGIDLVLEKVSIRVTAQKSMVGGPQQNWANVRGAAAAVRYPRVPPARAAAVGQALPQNPLAGVPAAVYRRTVARGPRISESALRWIDQVE
jgi:hypothetical protein